MAGNLILVHGGGPTAVINASLYGAIREAQADPAVEKVYVAIGGTGDVFADLVSARLTAGPAASAAAAFDAATEACWQHGAVADDWRAPQALTASRLAQSLHP